jgi:hypothetical protein
MVALGVALSAVVTLLALVRWWRKNERAIEVGTVSPSWLSEYKLGKRDTNWP